MVLRKKEVSNEVSAFRKNFSKMEYCLSREETMRIVPGLFESLFPEKEYALSLAGALKG